MIDVIRRLWRIHRDRIQRAAITLTAVSAVVWLGYQFWRLLFQPGFHGAIDLRSLQNATRRWFNGEPVYGDRSRVMYPPASFAMVSPIVEWLSFTAARVVSAVTIVLALWWLVRLTIRESGADTRLERIMMGLIPLSMYAIGASIGNGQLIVPILAALLAGITWLRRGDVGWRRELLACVCILFSLLKPTTSAPSFWIVLFAVRSRRPAILVATGYAALTWIAIVFQHRPLHVLVADWLHGSLRIAGAWGTANLSLALGHFGLERWILAGALASIAGLGLWIWKSRGDDLWALLGVTAIIARLCVYHWWFDDGLLLLPMIALFRIAKFGATKGDRGVIAGSLLALTLIFSLAPGGLYLFPPPFRGIYVGIQVVLWIVDAVFLVSSRRVVVRIL